MSALDWLSSLEWARGVPPCEDTRNLALAQCAWRALHTSSAHMRLQAPCRLCTRQCEAAVTACGVRARSRSTAQPSQGGVAPGPSCCQVHFGECCVLLCVINAHLS